MDAAAAGLALGAVLSGLGSLAAGIGSVRVTRRRASEFEQRIDEMNRAFERGLKLERRRKQRAADEPELADD